jgi:hypothetical protein
VTITVLSDLLFPVFLIKIELYMVLLMIDGAYYPGPVLYFNNSIAFFFKKLFIPYVTAYRAFRKLARFLFQAYNEGQNDING